MATVNAVNVTKNLAGGSGDNIVPDGYIKTVEKVWLDTYALASALATTSSIRIGRVPANKKITDIVVHLPAMQTIATSTSTVYCCTGATTSKTTYFGTLVPGGAGGTGAVCSATISTVRLCHSGAIAALAADTDIYLMIDPANTVTAGTIKTIIRYT